MAPQSLGDQLKEALAEMESQKAAIDKVALDGPPERVTFVDTYEDGITVAMSAILHGTNTTPSGQSRPMRVFKRDDGQIIVDVNDAPIMREWQYLAVVQDMRRFSDYPGDFKIIRK